MFVAADVVVMTIAFLFLYLFIQTDLDEALRDAEISVAFAKTHYNVAEVLQDMGILLAADLGRLFDL